MTKQFFPLFNTSCVKVLRGKEYLPILTAIENKKGVLDVDTVKGCTLGMETYPNGGCYSECYAYKNAVRYGINFKESVIRKLVPSDRRLIFSTIKNHKNAWYRIGVAGDPCHNWDNTISICEALSGTGKIPVIITKHWLALSDEHILRLKKLSAVVNTSISGLDTDNEINYRLIQRERLSLAGVQSVLRIVTCSFGATSYAKLCKEKQNYFLSLTPIINNPLRVSLKNKYVLNGDIIIVKRNECIGGGKIISLHHDDVYIGHCNNCLDQCGIDLSTVQKRKDINMNSFNLIPDKIHRKIGKVEFEYVVSVVGSGYEKDVAKLAIEDKVAYRAARKNMQIHSAIILKIDSKFSGFFTFQVNHEAGEFCLLQSAMELDKKDKEIYKQMLKEIIKQNTFGYPMIMTVSTKHDLECPKVLESVGFKTYLNLSGYEYMVYGTFDQIRMKRLAHATMTNTWNSVKGDWLRMKKEWNEKIEVAGKKHNIQNPKFASRDGCWQGSSGMSNVVLTKQKVEDGEIINSKGKSLNGNASVLDPVACEVILRFFMPKKGKRVYNPFGGGVQFGFVTGSYRYEYIASEIRQNQCDANNTLCKDLNNVKWIKSDSSTYIPEGKFDLIFSSPPYYKVEEYLDYDGKPPEGELNSIPTYEQFRDTLFSGYKKGIKVLNDNCFFVVMTGDSRDKMGAYYCCEAEHELFFKQQGLSIYNKIIYLECEFTRLAQAKKTLNYRKFPKREQKIIVAYKGDISLIKELYAPIGRL